MHRRLLLAAGALGLAALATPVLSETPPERIKDCLLDDPAQFRALLTIARAKPERTRPEAVEEAQTACDLSANPQAYPEQLALPMPCGRRMLFRRILTPGSSALAHHMGHFGDVKAESAGDAYQLSASPWEAPISGAFELASGQRAFYAAKYETTAVQWAVFEAGLFDLPPEQTQPGSEDCTAFQAALSDTNKGRPLQPSSVKPAGGIDWYDAILFSKAYSEWLVTSDAQRIGRGEPPVTPWRSGSTGFVRLPTEAEWEFAARGGEAGRESRAKRLPDLIDPESGQRRVVEDASAIAFVESDNAQALIGAVGSRAPNAFGLYDVVGNVEEIAFDLFRAVRPDGLHGQAGGYVARGGSSLTPAGALSVSSRREIPFISASGEGRSRTTGLRLILSAPVFSAARAQDGSWRGEDLDRAYTTAALADRKALAEAGGASDDRAALLQELTDLRAAAGSGDRQALETRLGELQALLERSNAQIEQFRAEALRDRAVSAVAIAWGVRQTGQRLYVARRALDRAMESMKKAGKPRKERRAKAAEVMVRLREINYELTTQFKLYMAGVQELAGVEARYLDRTLADARIALDSRGAGAFGQSMDWVDRHARAAQAAGGDITRDLERAWLFEVDEFRQRRLDTFGPLK